MYEIQKKKKNWNASTNINHEFVKKPLNMLSIHQIVENKLILFNNGTNILELKRIEGIAYATTSFNFIAILCTQINSYI